MYALSDYSYDLPKGQIAQTPCRERARSRLLHINRETGRLNHCRFDDIIDLLRQGDLLVVNNTRVVPARLLGRKKSGGRVEILIIDYTAGLNNLSEKGYFQCDCLVRASISPKEGSKIFLGDEIEAVVIQKKGYVSEIRFSGGERFLGFMNDEGRMPLPPYIKRGDNESGFNDPVNYQTVYAQNEGAVAAPTAGLHFTEDLMDQLRGRGIEMAFLTLHVGYGTFVPVRAKDIREHEIHSEYFSLSQEAAGKINQAKIEGRRVIAVGTTSVRTLEFCAGEDGHVKSCHGQCDLFIYPGYKFKCIDAMITNFHLPESTLLMLVSAFYSREKILNAYRTAVAEDYRFFSYGDAMFIE